MVSELCAEALVKGDAVTLGAPHDLQPRRVPARPRGRLEQEGSADQLSSTSALSSGCLGGGKLTGAGGGGSVLCGPAARREGREGGRGRAHEGEDTTRSSRRSPSRESEGVDGVTEGLPGPITVVKLGGSVITDKNVAFSYRARAVRELGKAMAASRAADRRRPRRRLLRAHRGEEARPLLPSVVHVPGGGQRDEGRHAEARREGLRLALRGGASGHTPSPPSRSSTARARDGASFPRAPHPGEG